MPSSIAQSSGFTVSQWFQNPMTESVRTSDALGWTASWMVSSHMNPPDDWYSLPITHDYFLTAIQNENRIHWRGTGQFPDQNSQLGPGMLSLFPPQMGGETLWEKPVFAAFLRIPMSTLHRLGEDTVRGDPAHISLIPHFMFSDRFLFALVCALQDELYQPAPLGPLFADSITHTLALHLLGRHSSATPAARPATNRLKPAQTRLLRDYIEDHLGQKLIVSDLAACVHVSVSHFERLFRATFGCPPYRYVLERRIERAQRLLRGGTLSVFEIARDCGFANQSHFTRHFTRIVGVSPAQFAGRFGG